MKICVAQTRPIKGNLIRNVSNHLQLIGKAVDQKVDLIIFPELSLTGYEPTLSHLLAIESNDHILDEFQTISNSHKITIGIGAPTKSDMGICISTIFFLPQQARQTYSKKYLHPDEESFFVSGQHVGLIQCEEMKIAPSICYELSIPDHADVAYKHGAKVYLVSMAKSSSGIEKTNSRLAEISRKYSMIVVASNNVGKCDNFLGAGKSSIWNDQGLLIGQLADDEEGILCVDTVDQKVI